MQEAKWFGKDYIATFDEYKENAIMSTGYYALTAVTFARMADVAKLDAFEWLSSHPKIRLASEIICRFTDDISSYEVSTLQIWSPITISTYISQIEYIWYIVIAV